MIVWLKILKLAAYRLRLQYFTLNSGLGWHFRIIRFQIAHLKESLDLRWHECHPWEIHNYSNSVLILTWQSWASQKSRSSHFLQEWSLLCCHASTPTCSLAPNSFPTPAPSSPSQFVYVVWNLNSMSPAVVVYLPTFHCLQHGLCMSTWFLF